MRKQLLYVESPLLVSGGIRSPDISNACLKAKALSASVLGLTPVRSYSKAQEALLYKSSVNTLLEHILSSIQKLLFPFWLLFFYSGVH